MFTRVCIEPEFASFFLLHLLCLKSVENTRFRCFLPFKKKGTEKVATETVATSGRARSRKHRGCRVKKRRCDTFLRLAFGLTLQSVSSLRAAAKSISDVLLLCGNKNGLRLPFLGGSSRFPGTRRCLRTSASGGRLPPWSRCSGRRTAPCRPAAISSVALKSDLKKQQLLNVLRRLIQRASVVT